MLSKRLFSTVSMLTAIVVSVLTVSSLSIAQGRYANVYSRNQVSDIIRKAEDSSDRFRTDFRNQMDQNRGLSNSQRNQYNDNVAKCEEALDRLRDHFNKNNSWWESRNQVQDVVRASQNVNTMMNVVPFRRYLENQWNQLRNSINTLADTYDLPGLNGGGWNGGGGRPGGGNGGNWPGWSTSRPPSWAVGTFYSTGGSDRIQLTISDNGRIAVVNNGQSFWGRFYNDQIYLNNDASTIARSRDGISTYNRNTGQTTYYSRTGSGSDGDSGNWPGWSTSNPPSWAVGTFYSANGSDNIQLKISDNGRIAVNNNGQRFWGRFYGNQIYLNNDVSDISRSNNGIRTYNRSTGQTTYYTRSGSDVGTGYPGGGINTSVPPSWAQGTFFSPGRDVVVTIHSNGRVTVVNGGHSYEGVYNNGVITVNGDSSTVTRNGNGISTYNQNTGQTTNYRRQ